MTTDPAVGLKDGQLSAIYQEADAVSGRGQRSTKLLVRTELTSVVVASIAGVTTLRVGEGRFDVLALVSAVAFAVALSAMTTRAIRKPEQGWYEGRAAAESARTLAWKFAMNADPFPAGLSDADATATFLRRIRGVLERLKDTDLAPPAAGERELTADMRTVRAAAIDVQRAVYKRDRIEDQLAWYVRRGGDHDRLARIWLGVAIGSSALGIVAAGFKFVVIDVDLLGVFAAIASSAIAWNQLNQHRNQATAYTVTALELRIIRDGIDTVPDDDWPAFVSDSEDAISREHTTWSARHGYLPLPGSG